MALIDNVVKAAVYPPIGIARVGDSADEFFIGPEVTRPASAPAGFYRDSKGALKRQAARFRIFGLDANGAPIVELNAGNAEITWTVHLANSKAAWYQFQIALDIPEADSADPSELRNKSVADRSQLIIDPGPRSIRGVAAGSERAVFDTGRFFGKPVYLGELRTDDKGRLLVLGGTGKSASFDGSAASTFANNDGWHDDASDGPVVATVSLNGRSIAVDPAWVVVAPPNYAPNQQSVRTMWDLLREVFVNCGMLDVDERTSFARDILPIFERLTNLQWVNTGIAGRFGAGAPNEYVSDYWLERLCDASDRTAALRSGIANSFRRFDRDGNSPVPWPPLYGDATNIPPTDSPRQHTALSDLQLLHLSRWADGNFIEDYKPECRRPIALDQLPVSEQASEIQTAALAFCLADAFHPGCEMTWPMRHSTLYMAPFRIRHRPEGWTEPGYGSRLTTQTVSAQDGPLFAQAPGGITRWMAVPWQTDTASCRSNYWAGYGPRYDPYLPTFWPARVPNYVLRQDDYEIVMNTGKPREERTDAFFRRASWFRQLGDGGYISQINALANDISVVGVVERRPGPADLPDVPAEVEVEQLARPLKTAPLLGGAVLLHVPSGADESAALRSAIASGLDEDSVTVGDIDKVKRFPRGLLR